MSKDPTIPSVHNFKTGNEKGANGNRGKQAHASTPVKGQMQLGKSHNIGARKGSFKGKPSDLRSEQDTTRFSKAAYRLAGPVDGGGAGHTKQSKGHSSLSRGNFGKKPGPMNKQG